MDEAKDTYFAPPERATEKEIAWEIEIVNENPVVSGLLHSISGLIAVLDKHRQIVALNDSFLRMLGVSDTYQAMGLRLGEVLKCVHAEDEPADCGTTKFCSTCGAAVAIVASLGQDKPVERICALKAVQGDREIDRVLLVKSHPIKVNDQKFLLLILQDITLQHYRAALERTFFHDINNMLFGLVGASEMLASDYPESDLVRIIRQSAVRLKQEVEIQKCLIVTDPCDYRPSWEEVDTDRIFRELRSFFSVHPVSRNKRIRFIPHQPPEVIRTDVSLLLRVLCNMVINALEATDDGGEVKIWLEEDSNSVTFCVWNHKPIPDDVALRVFQRNFSTKEGAGRGVGTYSMKLFGEQILGGQVNFTTSQDEGTVFRLKLPMEFRAENFD